jgi:hypothetical protein
MEPLIQGFLSSDDGTRRAAEAAIESARARPQELLAALAQVRAKNQSLAKKNSRRAIVSPRPLHTLRTSRRAPLRAAPCCPGPV